MPFKLAKPFSLAPATLFSTAEEAIAAGRQNWPGEDFMVQTVRQATLADFVVPANVIGDIREQLASRAGSETPLDDAIEAQTFNGEDFAVELRVFVDAYAEAKGFTMPGIVIVQATHTIKVD